MPRTVVRLRQIEEYAWRRWEATGFACDLWWNAAAFVDVYLRHMIARDPRFVIQEVTNGEPQ